MKTTLPCIRNTNLYGMKSKHYCEREFDTDFKCDVILQDPNDESLCGQKKGATMDQFNISVTYDYWETLVTSKPSPQFTHIKTVIDPSCFYYSVGDTIKVYDQECNHGTKSENVTYLVSYIGYGLTMNDMDERVVITYLSLEGVGPSTSRIINFQDYYCITFNQNKTLSIQMYGAGDYY